ncbi:MAG TPA: hypothetical protein VG326_04105 [Tepidisphaeraceae bacterium]|jgi:hypothetical protein|nr:hypothetical protein [Tepidisphaeraceae bacterium]
MPTPPIRNTATGESRAAAAFARVATGLLLVSVLLMVGRIYWRWHSLNEPSTVVIVAGDESLDGAKVEISGEHGHWTEKLNRDDGWQISVLLDAGTYRLVVTHRKLELLNESFSVDRIRGMRFDLPSMVVIVGSGQFADARIEIRCDPVRENFTRAEIKLEAQDHYRKALYLFPGSYYVVARSALNPDRVLARVDFNVDRAAPVRVDLTKAANEEATP